jgi:colanic acid biosynthesis glycosyl transferase WcaI
MNVAQQTNAPAPRSSPLRNGAGKTLLVFTQVFIPDPASVGQHVADVTFEMARRGHRVRVYTANRGYDDPTRQYPPRENLNGVEIRRLKFSSFGKKSLLTRGIGTAVFMVQALFVALFTPNVEGIFFSTSPPMIGLVASIAHLIRRYPIAYWAMDLNPDQLLMLGKVTTRSFSYRLLESINRFILRNASLIVALDRFMAARLEDRFPLAQKMVVMPPWPHEDCIESLDHSENRFRKEHNLADKFVIMYSGNHSPSNPLTTLLDAAVKLKDDDRIRFLFVGGGIGKKEVEQYREKHDLKNVISLPYQPLSELRYSLSAADVHVVSLGDQMVGIIHPCKIYGAMAVARPILYFGPSPSHIADLLEKHHLGLHVSHGDVAGALEAIASLRDAGQAARSAMGKTAQDVLQSSLSQNILCARICDNLEKVLQKENPHETAAGTAALDRSGTGRV